MTVVEDYSLIYAIAGAFTFFMFIFGILLIWVKLGGWPEGTYRMLRIPYFSAIFVDAGGTPRRFPLKLKELKTGENTLPAYFHFKGFANAKEVFHSMIVECLFQLTGIDADS